jgi:cytochrome c-type biogenesis protein CcmE
MKKSAIVAILLIAICIAVITSMLADFSQDTTFATAANKPNKSFQVVGTLDLTKPLEYDPLKDPNYFTFFVKDKEGTVKKVIFNSTKPIDFERSESVTLTGSMQDDAFKCTKILTKCPSKYKNENEFTASNLEVKK